MKRLAVVSVVLILLAAFSAGEALAQSRYYRGRGQYPRNYNMYSYYGNKIHHSPYGYPSWNYCPPRRYWWGPCYPSYPVYGGYPCYPYYYGGGFGGFGGGFGGGGFRSYGGGANFGMGFRR